MNKKINTGFLVISSLVVMAVLYFVMLPPINLQSFSFYNYLFLCFAISGGLYYISASMPAPTVDPQIKKISRLALGLAGLIVAALAINGIFFSPFAQASRYSQRITITNGNFSTDIPPISINSLPLLDKDSTERIGDRVMGEIPELISQFKVSNEYTQINQNNRLVRATPLEYADVFKWFINKDEGIPGYIKVDSTTGKAEFINVDGGIKYSPSAVIFNNLGLHLRLSYPTKEFSTSRFELNEEGLPFWITPTIQYTGIGMLADTEGIIITNATNGENEYYSVDNIPDWVDNVFPSNLVIEQVDDWGTYQGGFFNSIIGQKDVKISTRGYTYLTTGSDVSLYTGITSATQDESNIGFVLVNLRTKEAKYYPAPGAEEMSAMNSAQGAIQEKSYIATFPLLTNVDGRPTYLLSLKDNAGLVKSYALVDVADYQKVKVTDSDQGIEKAINEYRKMLGKNVVQETNLKEGIITNIQSIVMDGHSYYYLMIENDTQVYKADVSLSDRLPFMVIGDAIKFDFREDLFLTTIELK